MPYWVKGNAQQLAQAFGQSWMIEMIDDCGNIIEKDLPRTDFLGTKEQAMHHLRLWREEGQEEYYLQGNMTAGNLYLLLGTALPLKKITETDEFYRTNFVRQDFAYVNDNQETCGLMLIYRHDEPQQWMLGFVKNTHKPPQDREVILLSSFDLAPFIVADDEKETVVAPDVVLDEQFLEIIESDFPRELLKNAFDFTLGEVNKKFQRAHLLMRTPPVNKETADGYDAITFAELDLPRLFAENEALDRVLHYGLHLSFALLKDCISEDSELRKELERVELTENERINKNLLKMTVVFYEQGILEQNRQLLQDLMFIKTFGGYMWTDQQIELMPFLVKKAYANDLLRLILSEPDYYIAVKLLVELELTEDIPQFFKRADKLNELKFIHQIDDEACKKLCLIFWVKGSLSLDGYQQLIDVAARYPLLATTLIDLNHTKSFTVSDLKKLALNPQQHLQKSIINHFAEQLQLSKYPAVESGLHRLNQGALEKASEALIILKRAGIKDPKAYHSVLGSDKRGNILRLLLPQCVNHTDIDTSLLINILYEGVNKGISIQGKAVLAIKNEEQLALATALRERFICVSQMLELGFKNEVVALAANEYSVKAERFRKIILNVEIECKDVYERLLSSVSQREIMKKWKSEEAEYRKSIYNIAYNGLMHPSPELHANLQAAQERMLDIVDPHLESDLQKALIVISNIVITLLTLGIANLIKKEKTGNLWFFNHTRSGEQLLALDRTVEELIVTDELMRP